MRSASSQDHKTAESMHFIKHLMEGQLSKGDYIRYLNQLAYVYQALERKLSGNGPLPFAAALNRFDSIIADLEQFGVPDFTAAAPLPSTLEYVIRLQEIGDEEDVRLVAHHYTRYLGDLSGGQAIAALVQRHYGITADRLSFYRFDEIDNLVHFKEQYRKALDDLTISEQQLSVLLEETVLAFRLNQNLFADLGSQSVVD